jgi:hypothetical protein
MDRRSLERLDVLLGCFHSALRKKDVSNRRSDRHDSCRLARGGVRGSECLGFGVRQCSVLSDRVFDVAAELDKAVEIDGYPDRQDLSLELVKLAKESGCRISWGTDSHDPLQLRFIEYSLASAVRAGVKRNQILNFMSVDELRNWVASVRHFGS